ncbi:MAG: hypothetical protein U5L05_18185 [Rubrivivax sp.]|nr:hypothetical protein [Rubrivivax sp.]
MFGPEAGAGAAAADVPRLLDARLALTVAEYEAAEGGAPRSGWTMASLHVSLGASADHYAAAPYDGRGLLTFRGTRDHVRRYEWS